jgi:2-methylisocitrate lyase-like PEP mutase family enzyme
VLFAPGLRSLQDIASVVGAVQRPVNVMMGFAGADFGLAELAAVGVRRVSLGGSLARAALGALRRAADEVLLQGRFGYADQALPHAELNLRFGRPGRATA